MIIEDDHGQCVCVWSNKRCTAERTISVIVSPQEMQSVSECERRARPHYTISPVMITTGLNIMPPLPTQTPALAQISFLTPPPLMLPLNIVCFICLFGTGSNIDNTKYQLD